MVSPELVRSWGTGPDGLTQATLLTQTRAPSGERLRFFSKQTFDARFQKILDHLVVFLQVVLFDCGRPSIWVGVVEQRIEFQTQLFISAERCWLFFFDVGKGLNDLVVGNVYQVKVVHRRGQKDLGHRRLFRLRSSCVSGSYNPEFAATLFKESTYMR